jgi:hypothetical protein
LPVWRIPWARGINERSMRCQPRLALVRVETLYQRNFLWRLSAQVVPAVRRVVAHAERGTLPVRRDVPCRDKVLLWFERAPIRDGERVVRDRISDGTPHVDDSHSALKQAICVRGYMLPHACKACFVRLVDVHPCLEEDVNDRARAVRLANGVPLAHGAVDQSVDPL